MFVVQLHPETENRLCETSYFKCIIILMENQVTILTMYCVKEIETTVLK